jgi:hypothetical protein
MVIYLSNGKSAYPSPSEEPRMQINTSSSAEIAPKDQRESCCPRCPVCSGSLLPLRNVYRCTRCSFHLCAGCEAFDQEPPERD